MKKYILSILFVFATFISFSNDNIKVNKNNNIENVSSFNDEIKEDLTCQYTMTSSYMGGPSVTRTIYCNEGDDQKAQQEAVHRLAFMMWSIFGPQMAP